MARGQLKRRKEHGLAWKFFQLLKMSGLGTSEGEWEELYHTIPVSHLPWESTRPSPTLARCVEQGIIHGRVLDIGCGSGTQSVWMAEQGIDVVGIDIAETAVALSRSLATAHAAKAEFLVADAVHLPFGNGSFDSAFDRGTLQHLRGKERKYASEVARVLKPGGTFLLLTFSPRVRMQKGMSLDDLRAMFEDSFSLSNVGEEHHVQPDGREIRLSTYLLTRNA